MNKYTMFLSLALAYGFTTAGLSAMDQQQIELQQKLNALEQAFIDEAVALAQKKSTQAASEQRLWAIFGHLPQRAIPLESDAYTNVMTNFGNFLAIMVRTTLCAEFLGTCPELAPKTTWLITLFNDYLVCQEKTIATFKVEANSWTITFSDNTTQSGTVYVGQEAERLLNKQGATQATTDADTLDQLSRSVFCATNTLLNAFNQEIGYFVTTNYTKEKAEQALKWINRLENRSGKGKDGLSVLKTALIEKIKLLQQQGATPKKNNPSSPSSSLKNAVAWLLKPEHVAGGLFGYTISSLLTKTGHAEWVGATLCGALGLGYLENKIRQYNVTVRGQEGKGISTYPTFATALGLSVLASCWYLGA